MGWGRAGMGLMGRVWAGDTGQGEMGWDGMGYVGT